MNNSRLRKVEASLLKTNAKATPPSGIVIIYKDEADRERQLAEWQAKGGRGAVIMLPDNGRAMQAGAVPASANGRGKTSPPAALNGFTPGMVQTTLDSQCAATGAEHAVKTALVSAGRWCFNRQRQLKNRSRTKQRNNLRLRLLSESKLVISKQGQRLKHAQTGRE